MFERTDTVLVVGGTGFIGKHLALKCLEYTPHVACLGLPEKGNKNIDSRIDCIHADITNKPELEKKLKNKPFDYVFNCGGYINHIEYFKGGRTIIDAHFLGLLNIIDSIDKTGLKTFVQIGSSDEYGSMQPPHKECMRERSISPYSLAKTAGSHFIQMLSHTEGFPGTVLRFFLVYGPGQDEKRFLPQIISACLRDDAFKTSEGHQLRDFCYIDDVIDAVIKAAVTPGAHGRIINVASGNPVSVKDIIEKVISLVGGGKPEWGAHPYRKGENMRLYADISLARQILAWKPRVNIDDGLRKTIAYYKKN